MYPFLKEAKDAIKSSNIDLTKVDRDPLLISAVDAAKEDISRAFGISPKKVPEDIENISFAISKVLVGATGNPDIIERYVSFKTDEFRKRLEKETHVNLINIARDIGLGISTKDAVSITVFDFLKYRPDFMDLTTSNLEHGRVLITKNQLLWIIEKAIREDVLDSIKKSKKFPEEIIKHAKQLNNKLRIEEPRKTQELRIESLSDYALPPCMKEFISKLALGRATHNENYILGTFLVGLKLRDKEILSVFSKSPKYKDKTARYQIKFIREKNYSCPSCSSLKKDGICHWVCQKPHPVSVYFYNLKNAKRTS